MTIIFEIFMKIVISFTFGFFVALLSINLFGMINCKYLSCFFPIAIGVIFAILFAAAWIFEFYIVMLVLFILFTAVYVCVLFIGWLNRWLKK